MWKRLTCSITIKGGTEVLANIHLHCESSPRKSVLRKATETMSPNAIPKATYC